MMRISFLSDEHPARQLLITGLIVIACWLFFQLFSLVTGMFLFGIPLRDISSSINDLSNPVSLGFLKYMQSVTSAGMFIFASFISARLMSYNWLDFLTLKRRPSWYPLLLSVLFVIIILPFTNLLTYINNELRFPGFLSGMEQFFRSKELQMEQILEAFLDVSGFPALLTNIIVIAVIPAIGEELIFRGIVQNRFAAWFKNHHWAIFLTSFIFSSLHVQFMSFLPRFFLGVIFGYIFAWTGSIWITISAHFINNAMAVVFYYLYYNGKVSRTIEDIGTSEFGLIYSLYSLLLGIVLIYFIKRYYSRIKESP